MKQQVYKIRRIRAGTKGYAYFDKTSGRWGASMDGTGYAKRDQAEKVEQFTKRAYPDDVVEIFVTEVERATKLTGKA